MYKKNPPKPKIRKRCHGDLDPGVVLETEVICAPLAFHKRAFVSTIPGHCSWVTSVGLVGKAELTVSVLP